MNGNTINDIYIDSEQRIWMANYPIGITVRNNRYADYQWIKHSIGNKQSLINDQVNAIIEDHDGDLWFATNNGISLYYSKTKQWHSFLSSFDTASHSKNHIFISLCEVGTASSGPEDIVPASTRSTRNYCPQSSLLRLYSVIWISGRTSISVPLWKILQETSGPEGIIT